MHVKFVGGARVQVNKLFEAKVLLLAEYPDFVISDLWQRDNQGFLKKVLRHKGSSQHIATIHFGEV